MDFLGKNTGVGCHFLQKIFPTLGSNPHLLHGQENCLCSLNADADSPTRAGLKGAAEDLSHQEDWEVLRVSHWPLALGTAGFCFDPRPYLPSTFADGGRRRAVRLPVGSEVTGSVSFLAKR